MGTYAIGDIQGCYSEFQRLLDKFRFDAARDQLILLGDLVNRGTESLDVIQFAMEHENSVRVILGNHDLHLLSILDQVRPLSRTDTFADVLAAADRDRIQQWLLKQPLLIYDSTLNYLAVHAGVHPQWDLAQSVNYAREVEALLQSKRRQQFFSTMFCNSPLRWSDSLSGWERVRFFVNVFTRMRFIHADGSLDFTQSGPHAPTNSQLKRWFEYPERKKIEPTIVFGHWSALGVYHKQRILAMDSGCCWGRKLSAARLDTNKIEITKVSCSSRMKQVQTW